MRYMSKNKGYRYGIIRYMVAILLMVMGFCGAKAQKKTILFDVDTSYVTPPFRANIDVLLKNRALYNQYNDSIFMIKDHDQWVNFFRRRALKNHQIFAANKVALDNIFGYFKRDTLYSWDYHALLNAYAYYRQQSGDDPFMTLEFCNVLEQYNQVCPDSLKMSNLTNLWLATAYSLIANLGNDATKHALAVSYLKRILEPKSSKYPEYEWAYPMALLRLVGNTYLKEHWVTMAEHQQYFSKLKEWYLLHPNDTISSKTTMQNIKRTIQNHDEDLVRNLYMADTTVMPKQLADSLMRKIIKRNLAAKKLSDVSFIRTLAMQVWLKDISASEGVQLWLERYRNIWKQVSKKNMDHNEFKSYLTPFFTFFYLNDISDESYSKKRRIVKRMCANIEVAYQHRKDQQQVTDYVKYLNVLTTYERITKYLTPKERIHFLNSLNVATQVTTYAHSVHVSMIAEELMKGILKYQPELLIGSLGDLQISEVVRHQKKYIEFAHDAAMYHDLGKNSIISVVNNDYRPLTDEEFAIIKKHPALGLQYLELAPELAKFHDTTLGHHKWYNGKGGYPDNFDNTKSPKRILIDMVTLSDCMQAATERVGRNYKGEKNFDTVMAEFRKDAGVRYNPDLVALIDAHPDLAKKLADLINEGWVEIYYNIYSQFIK